MWRVALIMSVIIGFISIGLLKVMHIVEWIDWHPTAFLKSRINEAEIRWLTLLVIISIGCFVFYLLVQYLYKLPHYIIGVLLGGGLAILLEWWILSLPLERASIRQLSIPFIVYVIMMAVWIVETATFYKKISESPNNLL